MINGRNFNQERSHRFEQSDGTRYGDIYIYRKLYKNLMELFREGKKMSSWKMNVAIMQGEVRNGIRV